MCFLSVSHDSGAFGEGGLTTADDCCCWSEDDDAIRRSGGARRVVLRKLPLVVKERHADRRMPVCETVLVAFILFLSLFDVYLATIKRWCGALKMRRPL